MAKAVANFLYMSTRSLAFKFKFEKGNLCEVVAYGQFENDVEENGSFYNNLNVVFDEGSWSFRVIALGYLSCWLGNQV